MWSTTIPLRMNDIDCLRHLTATAYMELFEEARAAWMIGSLGLTSPNYVVASQTIDYLEEVLHEESPVTIELIVTDVGRTSVRVAEQLVAAGRVRARSSATLVMWDLRTPREITRDERAALDSFAASPLNA